MGVPRERGEGASSQPLLGHGLRVCSVFLFHGCLGRTLMILQTPLKTQPVLSFFLKSSLLRCGWNGGVRPENLEFPNSLSRNRSELIRGADGPVTAETALLLIAKCLVNQQ